MNQCKLYHCCLHILQSHAAGDQLLFPRPVTYFINRSQLWMIFHTRGNFKSKQNARCRKELMAVTKFRLPNSFWPSTQTSKMNNPLQENTPLL